MKSRGKKKKITHFHNTEEDEEIETGKCLKHRYIMHVFLQSEILVILDYFDGLFLGVIPKKDVALLSGINFVQEFKVFRMNGKKTWPTFIKRNCLVRLLNLDHNYQRAGGLEEPSLGYLYLIISASLKIRPLI